MKSSFIITASKARACYGIKSTLKCPPSRAQTDEPILLSTFPNTHHLPFDPQKIILDRETVLSTWLLHERYTVKTLVEEDGVGGCLVHGRLWNFKRRHKPESTTQSRQNKEIQFRAQREGEGGKEGGKELATLRDSRFDGRRNYFYENKTNRSGLNSKTRKTIRLSRHLRNFTMSNVALGNFTPLPLVSNRSETKSVYREEFIRPVVRVSLQFCSIYPWYFHYGGISLD